jgi:hypothetical protein
VCAVLVAMHAARRYDTPETNRLTTTQTLFNLTRAGYVAASLALFFVLAEVALKPGVFPFPGLGDIQTTVANYVAPPVLAVLLLCVVFPGTPVIQAGDAWLLKYFQSLGRIPYGVRMLAEKLTPSALPVGESDIEELRDWILYDAEVPMDLAESLSADRPETSRGGFTRALKLYVDLQKLAALPAYATSFRARQDAWQAVQADFRVFVTQSLVFFFYFDELKRKEGSTGENALNKAKSCYREICLNMHRQAVEFLAQLILMVEQSDVGITNRLRSIGFAV